MCSKLLIIFLCKVKEAVSAQEEHLLAFEEFNMALPMESMKEWTVCIEVWK
jgi:hypothetical protein